MSPAPPRPEVHVRSRSQMYADGFTRADITRALDAGRIRRLGRGLYGTVQTPSRVAAAVSRGHRITCIEALSMYGFWTPPHSGEHEAALRAGRRTSSLPNQSAVVLHDPPLRRWPDAHPVLPLDLALQHASHCLDPEQLAIILESGLNRGLIDAADVRDAMATIPEKKRAAVLPLRRDAESGTETRVRRALTRRGVQVQPQARIAGVGRVDLLVGEKLIIECDSHAFHASPAQITNDRRRDLAARDLGYTVLRLSYHQVMHDWETTLAMIIDAVRRREHRARRRSATSASTQAARPAVVRPRGSRAASTRPQAGHTRDL